MAYFTDEISRINPYNLNILQNQHIYAPSSRENFINNLSLIIISIAISIAVML